MAEVLIAEARARADTGDHAKEGVLYLTASQPELALVLYQEADLKAL